MANNKQSSVEWFANESWQLKVQLDNQEISVDEYAVSYVRLLYKAKEMEKEQTINLTEDWYFNGPLLGEGIDVKNTIEQHFNKTYGGGEQ